MPFTLAHPCVVAPMARGPLILSALVIGSIVPDFDHFFRYRTGHFSHSLIGLFAFCLPVGLLLMWWFHSLVKRPTLDLLPDGDRSRLEPYSGPFDFRSPRRIGWIVVSLLIGAVTHVVWDSFTHKYGWLVENYDWPTQPLFKTKWYTPQIYSGLQHASTFAGLLAVALLYLRWRRKAPVSADCPTARLTPRQRLLLALTLMVGAGLAGLAITCVIRLPLAGYYYAVRLFIVTWVIMTLSFLLIFWTAYAIAWRLTAGHDSD